MKKKIWNTESVSRVKSMGSWISAKHTTGVISFSQDLVAAMQKAFPNNHTLAVMFVQNEESPKEWFLQVSDDPTAIKLRYVGEKALRKQNPTIQHIALVRAIYDSLEFEFKGILKIVVGTEYGEHGFEIISKSARLVISRSTTAETV